MAQMPPTTAPTPVSPHPLSPLTGDEMKTARQIVFDSGRATVANEALRFAYVGPLRPPQGGRAGGGQRRAGGRGAHRPPGAHGAAAGPRGRRGRGGRLGHPRGGGALGGGRGRPPAAPDGGGLRGTAGPGGVRRMERRPRPPRRGGPLARPGRPVAGGDLRARAREAAAHHQVPGLPARVSRRQRLRPTTRGAPGHRRPGAGRGPRGARLRHRAGAADVGELLPRAQRATAHRPQAPGASRSRRARASWWTATW